MCDWIYSHLYIALQSYRRTQQQSIALLLITDLCDALQLRIGQVYLWRAWKMHWNKWWIHKMPTSLLILTRCTIFKCNILNLAFLKLSVLAGFQINTDSNTYRGVLQSFFVINAIIQWKSTGQMMIYWHLQVLFSLNIGTALARSCLRDSRKTICVKVNISVTLKLF